MAMKMMRNFIAVTQQNGKMMYVNVNTIFSIEHTSSDSDTCKSWITPNGSPEAAIKVMETTGQIMNMINSNIN